MSCGKPHETPCSDVLEQVWLFLDNELPDSERHQIRHHLDECAPCLRLYGLEEVVKALVARSCGGDVAPVELRHKVVARLHTIEVEYTHIEYRAD